MPSYNKLVRDKIPAIIASNGGRAKVIPLDDNDYAKELERKLQEEVAEYLADKNAEELADIMEVVLALAGTLGCSPGELEAVRKNKAEARGAFDKRLLLVDVEETGS